MPMNPPAKPIGKAQKIEAGFARHTEVVLFALGVVLGAVLGSR